MVPDRDRVTACGDITQRLRPWQRPPSPKYAAPPRVLVVGIAILSLMVVAAADRGGASRGTAEITCRPGLGEVAGSTPANGARRSHHPVSKELEGLGLERWEVGGLCGYRPRPERYSRWLVKQPLTRQFCSRVGRNTRRPRQARNAPSGLETYRPRVLELVRANNGTRAARDTSPKHPATVGVEVAAAGGEPGAHPMQIESGVESPTCPVRRASESSPDRRARRLIIAGFGLE